MKKSLMFLLFASATASFVSAANYEATTDADDVKGSYDNLIFKGNGVETGIYGNHLDIQNDITVDSGVKAVLYTAYTDETLTSTNYAVNAGRDKTGLSITGAGKDLSELTLGTHIFNAGFDNAVGNRVDATINKLTLNFEQLSYKGTTLQANLFRAKNFIINDAIVNIKAGSTSIELEPDVAKTETTPTVNNILSINNKGVLNVFGKLTVNNNIVVNSGGVLNASGNSSSISATSIDVNSGGKFYVKEGATYSGSYVQGSGEIIIDGYYNASKVRLNKGGELVLNVSNIATNSGYRAIDKTTTTNGGAGLACVNIYDSASVYINAQNKLGGFCVTSADTAKTVTLTFGDRGDADYLLYLEYLVYRPGDAYYANNDLSSKGGVFYDLKDFTTGDLVLDAKITDAQIEAAQSHFLLDSETGKITFEKQNINGTNYWVATAVPEPAEWAAIFGAVAFAFTLYRRKK